jgi:3-oxoadipate enol-lactonase
MPFARMNDHVEYYLTAGDKHMPALVFANSLGSDLRIWDVAAELLGKHFRTIRYDQRGHGLSEAPPSPYRVEDLARDLTCLLGKVGIGQAILCGVSVGALIAQAVALNCPERVRALILCDTGARIGSVESWQQRIDTVRAGGLKPLEVSTMERWFSNGFRAQRPDDVRGYLNMLRQTSIEGYIGTCCALREGDFRKTIPRVNCPTLVLCGAEDIATPPELGRELASLISGARFSLIDNAAHMPCIEQPELLAERITQFCREVQIV